MVKRTYRKTSVQVKGEQESKWKGTAPGSRETLSIVPPEFKARYAEKAQGGRKPRILARSCGDWLASLLAKETLDEEGHLNIPKLDAIMNANGVDCSNINRSSPGWQGRLRMTGRVMLAAKARRSQVVVVPGRGRIATPREWLRERKINSRAR